jgi:hypothetical protein
LEKCVNNRIIHVSRIRAPLCAACLILSFITVSISLAASPEEQALFKQVAVLYRANRDAIQSVECDYTFFLDSTERRCRYARDRERHYHASIDLYPDGGRAMARESAWDGQVALSRRNAEYLTKSSDREDAKPTCDVPEHAIRTFVDEALGTSSRQDQKYTLISAKRVQTADGECVEMQFSADWSGGKLIARHARAFGYLPISVQYFDQTGQLSFEMTHVDYVTREVHGNRLHYPCLVLQVVYAKGRAEDLMRYEVDKDTLRINHDISDERFVLPRWPSDKVVDLQTLQETPPTDPGWSPIGREGFPYNLLIPEGSPTHSLVVNPDSQAAPSAFKSIRPRGGSGKAPQPTLISEASNEDSVRVWTWTSLLGIALTLLGIVMVVRNRWRMT